MGKDKKKEAERQRGLRLKRKNELSKYKAFYAYAQIKNPGMIEAFEAEQATSKMVDQSSTTDFTHWLVKLLRPRPQRTLRRQSSSPQTQSKLRPQPQPTQAQNHPQWDSILRASTDFSLNCPILTFKIQRLKQKFY